MIFLDNASTTQVFEEAASRAKDAMTEFYFNPSAAYDNAYQLEKEINHCRDFAAGLMSVSPSEIYFTSGGTESNNIAIWGTLRKTRGKARIVTTMIEHPSVYETILCAAKQFGADIEYAPLNPDGTVNTHGLEQLLDDSTTFVSIMHVNNELGSVNDIQLIADLIKKHSPQAVFHSDGVQGFLKTDTCKNPCDLYSVSGHKFHAPKGVGILLMRKHVRNAGGQIGGGQENGFRSGTLNVPAILGMDTAMRVYHQNFHHFHETAQAVKFRLFQNLMMIPDTVLNGPSCEKGSCFILNMSFLGVKGEVLLHTLEQKGILVSTGSACSSRKVGKNRILSALGITGPRQEGAIRFSFSPRNTLDEIDYVSDIISREVSILRRYKRR